MAKIMSLTFAAAFLANIAPALGGTGCDERYKNFLSKTTVYIDRLGGSELADHMRRSLDAYNSCQAGDSFSAHGVWDQIRADMAAKAKAGDGVDN